MQSIYLSYRGREWTITDEAFEQIAEIVNTSLVCKTCKQEYSEDNMQVAQNCCLSCFLVQEQRHGITFLDQINGHFRFIDPRGEIRLTDVDSTESRIVITETIRYHGFPVPESIVVNGETKSLSQWHWQIHGEKTRSCVVLQHGTSYSGAEIFLFLAYKNGSFVELNKRKRAHRDLLQRARNQIEASKDREGYYRIGDRRSYGMYESMIYEVAAEIASIEFDVSGKVLE